MGQVQNREKKLATENILKEKKHVLFHLNIFPTSITKIVIQYTLEFQGELVKKISFDQVKRATISRDDYLISTSVFYNEHSIFFYMWNNEKNVWMKSVRCFPNDYIQYVYWTPCSCLFIASFSSQKVKAWTMSNKEIDLPLNSSEKNSDNHQIDYPGITTELIDVTKPFHVFTGEKCVLVPPLVEYQTYSNEQNEEKFSRCGVFPMWISRSGVFKIADDDTVQYRLLEKICSINLRKINFSLKVEKNGFKIIVLKNPGIRSVVCEDETWWFDYLTLFNKFSSSDFIIPAMQMTLFGPQNYEQLDSCVKIFARVLQHDFQLDTRIGVDCVDCLVGGLYLVVWQNETRKQVNVANHVKSFETLVSAYFNPETQKLFLYTDGYSKGGQIHSLYVFE